MTVKKTASYIALMLYAPVGMAASVNLYGSVNLSADFYGGAVDADHPYAISSNQSYAGFNGGRAFDRGVALIYQWEAEMDWGSEDGVSHGINEQRDTFIGLSGDWGSVRAGRQQTPLMQLGRRYDLFADTIGDARAAYNQTGFTHPEGARVSSAPWDQRRPGLFAYQSPESENVQTQLMAGTQQTPQPDQPRDVFGFGSGLVVDNWRWDAALEHQRHADQTSTQAWRMGAAVEQGNVLLTGFYQRDRQSLYAYADNTTPVERSQSNVWGVGGVLQTGKQRFKAQFYQSSGPGLEQDDGARLWALGLEQRLSRSTYFYSVLAYMDNQHNNSYYTLGQNAGAGRMAPANSEQGNKHHAFSIGLRHHF